MSEQRRAQRFDVATAAEVFTTDGVLSAQTRNLSSTGVCLDLDRELPESATVGVSLFLTHDGIEDPDVEPLNVKAEVIWCSEREDHGFSAGMRFGDLDAPGTQALELFLSALG